MSENVPAVPEREEIMLPHNGALVDLGDERAAALALAELRGMEAMMAEAKRALTRAIVARAAVRGSHTLDLDGVKVTVKRGRETVYDAEAIEQELRALGMPEERIREIVVETVSYKVKATEAKKAAGINDDYAAVIESNRTVVEKHPSVEINVSRRRT